MRGNNINARPFCAAPNLYDRSLAALIKVYGVDIGRKEQLGRKLSRPPARSLQRRFGAQPCALLSRLPCCACPRLRFIVSRIACIHPRLKLGGSWRQSRCACSSGGGNCLTFASHTHLDDRFKTGPQTPQGMKPFRVTLCPNYHGVGVGAFALSSVA